MYKHKKQNNQGKQKNQNKQDKQDKGERYDRYKKSSKYICLNDSPKNNLPDINYIFANLGKDLNSVRTIRDAALVIFDAADKLVGWDACYLNIYSEKDDSLSSVINIDTIDGVRKEFTKLYEKLEPSSITRKVLKEGGKLILRKKNDVQKPDEFIRFGNVERKSASLIIIPVKRNDKNVGILSIQSYEFYKYNQGDYELINILTDYICGALERILAEEELIQKEDLSKTFSDLGKNLSAATTPKEAAQVIINAAKILFGWDACYINMYFENENIVTSVITIDTINSEISEVKPAYDGTAPSPIALKTLNEGPQLILRNEMEISENNFYAFGDINKRSASLMYTPIRKGSKNVGILSIQSYTPYAYDLSDLEQLQILADHCSGALARTFSEKALKEAHEELERRVEERTKELSESNKRLKKEIKERKQIQKALARSESIYRETIENTSGVPYRLYYKSRKYDFIGSGIKSLLGIEPEDATCLNVGELVKEYVFLDPNSPPTIQEYWAAFENGKLDKYRVDLKVITKNGEEKWINDCAVPIIDEKTGKIIGSQGILQDISQRKQAEEKARMQQEQLIQTERLAALGILVSGVAHEINNPNNFIMLNTPILMESFESIYPVLDDYYKEQGDFLVGGLNYSEMRNNIPELFKGIIDGSKRIRNIVDELRDFARKHPSEFMEPVDVNAIIKSALSLISNMIKTSTNKFFVEYSDEIPIIKGNYQRLEQVIINLIQNSCQSLPDKNKGIYVLTEYNKKLKTIKIKIRDEGIGIPESNLKHIMDPFFTTKRDSGGTGLGLSISSNIIAEHGGSLTINSKQGTGTTVIVSLPKDFK